MRTQNPQRQVNQVEASKGQNRTPLEFQWTTHLDNQWIKRKERQNDIILHWLFTQTITRHETWEWHVWPQSWLNCLTMMIIMSEKERHWFTTIERKVRCLRGHEGILTEFSFEFYRLGDSCFSFPRKSQFRDRNTGIQFKRDILLPNVMDMLWYSKGNYNSKNRQEFKNLKHTDRSFE